MSSYDAREREAILDMFKGMCELHNYEPLLTPPIEKEKLRKSLLKTIETEIDLDDKYYLYGSVFTPDEKLELLTVKRTETDVFHIAEVIDFAYKMLFNLNIENIIINVKDVKGTLGNCANIIEELDALDIPAIHDENTTVDKTYDKDIAFDVLVDDEIIGHGGVNKETGLIYYKLEVEDLEKEFEFNEESTILEAYIFPESEEVKSDALEISSTLRECGFRIQVDYSLDKNNINDEELNAVFLITFDEEDIKKYQVKIKDLATKEIKEVPIDNIIEVLNFM